MKNWLIDLNQTIEPPFKCRLFCFPFAGGGTVNYVRWRSTLNPEIGLYGFNIPGRERLFKEPCLDNYERLIEQLADLISQYNDLPILLFGHSFGGLTAYFVSLTLQKIQGITPVHLYVSARVPPAYSARPIASLDDGQFKEKLVEKYQGIPQQILQSPELLSLFLPILKKDFYLYEQYPEIYKKLESKIVNVPITSFQFKADTPRMEAFQAWQEHTSQSYKHIQLEGGHFALLQQWHALTEEINKDAERLLN